MDIKRIVTPDRYGGFRDILLLEWGQYDWDRVTTYEDWSHGREVYLRGKRKVDPPDDGYQYQRCDTFSDSEYKWERLIPENELVGAK